MPPTRETIELTEEQVLYFRARRGYLTQDKAPDVITAARAMLGAQSQQVAPSLWALSLRTQGNPTVTELHTQLYDAPRALVRTWGQRETIHIYDATTDWANMIVLSERLPRLARRGLVPTHKQLQQSLKLIRKLKEPKTRKNLYPTISDDFVETIRPYAEKNKLDPIHIAAGRTALALADRGDFCIGRKIGAQQSYELREDWFEDLKWPSPLPPIEAVGPLFLKRYLATYGAATIADIAHFFGTRQRDIKAWIPHLEAQTPLIQVHCNGRNNLLALAEDQNDLEATPPKTLKGWPVRLLPLWEAMLMGHADKSWTVPDPDERPLVWRKAALVMAVVLVRGRIVATWTQKKTRKRLSLQVTPLSLWRTSKHKRGVEREARALADHLGLSEVTVEIVRHDFNEKGVSRR